ncbi:hypothetical protein EV363DRAFT_1451475 [Boletus edulis]|nr:hypothetical protein EV363DRAFT_1451475 [Boletus edulis]
MLYTVVDNLNFTVIPSFAEKLPPPSSNHPEAILRLADYVTKKTVLDAAQKTSRLGGAGWPKLSIAQPKRSKKIAFDSAQAALAAYKRTNLNDVLFESANRAIVVLSMSAEYVAFQTATTFLSAAKSSTLGRRCKSTFGAEEGSMDVLDIGKAIVSAGAEAVNITSVHLSGRESCSERVVRH